MDENTNTNTEVNAEQQEAPKTYTAEEVQAMLQKEGDRRVSSAKQKYERTIEALKKQVENEKSLSQLDEEARAAKEKELRIAELEEQLKAYQLDQKKTEILSALSKRNLATFADFIRVGDDAEENLQIIEGFQDCIKKLLAQERKAWLAETANVPQIAEAMSGKMTAEKFRSLSLPEQQAMYDADPELVRNLLG